MIREKIILKYIKNKDVLDIGSVGQTQEYNLWEVMKKEAKYLVGIDIEPSNDKDIVLGNMENYDFCCDFDVIIAGDVLEHTDNQGLFLNNINKHLKENGVLILTTPNAKWLTVLFKPSPTHTLWHDKYTLFYILQKHGFKITHFQYYFGNKKHYNLFKRFLVWRQQMLVICNKEV